MSPNEGPSIPSVDPGNRAHLPLWRLYTLRGCYFILSAGLGVYVWPSVISHSSQYAASRGVQCALLAGIGATALLGFRYPLKMVPLLLFELTWKAIYLIGFALPASRAHQITPAMAGDISSILVVVILLPLIPWRYVVAEFAMRPGDRWR